MTNWLQKTSGQIGSAVGAFRANLDAAYRRSRPAFIASWAEQQKWAGGVWSKRGSQRRAIQNSWVYTAVEMIAREVSASKFGVVRQTDVDAEPVAIDNHPLERLLRRPNPWIGRSFLWQYTALWLMLDGNAYWYISCSEDGTPVEIWPLPSQDVEPRPGDGERFIDHYEYTANGTIYHIPAEVIVHFRLPNPFDIFRGLSPLAAAMLPTDADSAMARWNGAFFGRDNVMPSAIINLSSGDANRPINPADAEALKHDLRSEYSAVNRKTAITTANSVQAVLLGWNPKEMDFISGRMFTKEEIYAVYGVPSGLLDKNSTEANATTADKVFKEKTIWPLLCLIAEEMTAELVMPYYGADQEAAFDDIRPANRMLELQEVAAGGSYLTIDEVRGKYWQLDPLPDGKGTLPAAMSASLAALSMPGLPPGGDALTGGLPALLPPAKSYSEIGMSDLFDADLRRWRDKAIKSVKAGRGAAVEFKSEFIPSDIANVVRARLTEASTADQVRMLFAEVEPSAGFFRGQGGVPLAMVGVPPGRYFEAGLEI